MNSFDNDMNEETGSRQGGGSSFRSSANSRLMENSALREAENEAINIMTKINTNPLEKSTIKTPLYQYNCSTTRTKLLDICSKSKICHTSNIRPAIDDMCQ